MTRAAVAFTTRATSAEAGQDLGRQIAEGLSNASPDALVVFASSTYDYPALLRGVDEAARPAVLVGCSSAGEFVSGQQGAGSACALALTSSELRFAATIGRGLRTDRDTAARDLVRDFQGPRHLEQRYRYALILTDALAGYTDDLIDRINRLTGGTYQLFGGGAGDDARFERTHVFHGTNAYADAAVALEILSDQPLGIGVGHGWAPNSDPFRVTEAEGTRLISLNAAPAVEAFEEHAERTGQPFDPVVPIPFFLHNVLGIDTGAGFKLRVPLGIDSHGALACASDVPAGATARIMGANGQSTIGAAARATSDALRQLGGRKPAAALFFDCVATRLRLGQEFDFELDTVQERLGAVKLAGCNTYGQIARAEGQFNGFHNCTAVVCVIPE